MVAIAGDHHIVAKGPHHALHMRHQRLAPPENQPLVTATHALATATGEDQRGEGR
ncbi:hypothetical protein D3C73_1340080 [compost metagenome]